MSDLLFDKALYLPNTMLFLLSVKSVFISIYMMLDGFVLDTWSRETGINYLIKSYSGVSIKILISLYSSKITLSIESYIINLCDQITKL